MHTQTDATVFIVDDDVSVREGMAWLLRTRHLLSESFDSAEAFLEALGAMQSRWPPGAPPPQVACLLLDVRMPGLSGLALFEQLLARGIAEAWPVIFLTGHADVPTAVDSVKRGAFDFCEKPFSDNALVDRVEQALNLSQERLDARLQKDLLQSRLSELTERDGKRFAPTGTPVEWVKEESYFFKLSAYADKLLAHYEAHPDFITPDKYRNEIVAFVKRGLKDLSISRTTFNWGVPVPGDPKHVMYVWVDALTNYITGAGFPDAQSPRAKYWPADAHVIGKDITRFHAVYWPAFLMSAGVELPRQIVVHGFLFNKGEKMSKSVGNVIDPQTLADHYGVDQLRYFFLREVPFGQDGNYSHEGIVARINADLANDLGNLAQRSLSMIFKNLDGKLSADQPLTDADRALLAEVDAGVAALKTAFEDLAFSDGLDSWMRAVFACNQYVDEQAPWALRKTDPARMQVVLMTLFEAVRSLAIAIRPVVPASAERLLDQMGIPAAERDFAALADREWLARLLSSVFVLGQPVGVFPRLELPETETAA